MQDESCRITFVSRIKIFGRLLIYEIINLFKWDLLIVVLDGAEFINETNEIFFKKHLFVNNRFIFTAIITNIELNTTQRRLAYY